MIEAKIITDSRTKLGCRLTTFVLTFPRIILSEFNTHRMFTRNSASSRAIPFNKMLDMVKTNPFIPIQWMKDHTGMQGTEYFTGVDCDILEKEWIIARDSAVRQTIELNKCGVTKQIVNRLLEPFMWHKVLLTATDFENFFSLRADEHAEIHMQDLANKMLIEYNNSEPNLLRQGEWHIPFGDLINDEKLFNSLNKTDYFNEYYSSPILTKIKIATSRCARISYNNFEGKDDYLADLKLHDKLLESGHFSPFEHCAYAMDDENYYGNFKGFMQYRKTLINENRKDNRVELK